MTPLPFNEAKCNFFFNFESESVVLDEDISKVLNLNGHDRMITPGAA